VAWGHGRQAGQRRITNSAPGQQFSAGRVQHAGNQGQDQKNERRREDKGAGDNSQAHHQEDACCLEHTAGMGLRPARLNHHADEGRPQKGRGQHIMDQVRP
jgi:hypothetical protein